MRRRFEALTGGSLLRRTLLSVVTLLVGSGLFVALLSLALVSTAKGLLPSSGSADDAASADGKAAITPAGKPAAKGLGKRPTGVGVKLPAQAAESESDGVAP